MCCLNIDSLNVPSQTLISANEPVNPFPKIKLPVLRSEFELVQLAIREPPVCVYDAVSNNEMEFPSTDFLPTFIMFQQISCFCFKSLCLTKNYDCLTKTIIVDQQ